MLRSQSRPNRQPKERPLSLFAGARRGAMMTASAGATTVSDASRATAFPAATETKPACETSSSKESLFTIYATACDIAFRIRAAGSMSVRLARDIKVHQYFQS
jgi:hypothetical protein